MPCPSSAPAPGATTFSALPASFSNAGTNCAEQICWCMEKSRSARPEFIRGAGSRFGSCLHEPERCATASARGRQALPQAENNLSAPASASWTSSSRAWEKPGTPFCSIAALSNLSLSRIPPGHPPRSVQHHGQARSCHGRLQHSGARSAKRGCGTLRSGILRFAPCATCRSGLLDQALARSSPRRSEALFPCRPREPAHSRCRPRPDRTET